MELHKKIAVGVVAVAALVGVPGDHASGATKPAHGRVVTIPTKPCKEEDSRNCYWDAGRVGNGHGYSFWTDAKGHVTYLNPRVK